MKKKTMSIVLAAALILQMLPLPIGCLAGVLGVFRVSEAAGATSGTIGDSKNITWKLTPEAKQEGWLGGSTVYKLELTGTGDMPAYTSEAYKKNPTDTYNSYRTNAPWKESIEEIQTISIGSGITNVSSYAFYGCSTAMSADIPEGVKNVGNSAFQECVSLKQVTLPSTVESIGTWAFGYCTALDNIIIPDKINSIGGSAFQYCSSLSEIVVPSAVKEIKSSTFYNCKKLKKAVISEGVEVIGNSAFGSCESLADLALPQTSLTSIGSSAFNGSNLTSVTIPASVTSIGLNPFVGGILQSITVEQGNQNYESVNDLLVEKKNSALYKVISYPCKGNAIVNIPAPVEVIGDQAFQSTGIQSADLPGSLRSIGKYAFNGARYLGSIEVPGLVKTIGNEAFYSCSSLSEINLGGDLLSIGDYAFYNCSAVSGLTLPDKMTTIGSSAFGRCSKLKELAFPNSIETIGGSVLENCTSLERVSFGGNVKNVLGNVFKGCPKLSGITVSESNANIMAENNVLYNKEKSKIIYYASGMAGDKFSIPDTVKTVGSYAFTYCTHLAEVRFPEAVESLEINAVYHNDSVTKLLFYGNAPTVTEDGYCTVGNTNGYTEVCYALNSSVSSNSVKGGSYDNTGLMVFKTKESTGWENGWESTKVYKSHESHTEYEWRQGYLVEEWDPDKTDVSSGTFGDLKWDYRDDIGQITFSGEGKVPDFKEDELPTWSLADGVDHMQDIKLVETGDAAEIGNNAFLGAKRLRVVFTENKLTRVGERAFANCTALEVIRMQNVARIEKEAFMGDTALKDELDMRGCQIFGEGVFKGCTGMTDILLGEGLKSIGKEAFASCSALESMMLPESVQTLGDGCFNGCSTLRTINIPKRVTAVPAACFVGCAKLQKVYFYGNYPDSWANDCFSGTDNGLTVYYRASNKTWSAAGDKWNGYPVVGLDKFYTEQKDHYSFANTGSSFGYGSKYFVPRQRYVTAVQSVIRGSYYYAWDSSWKGSCFGMAASSAEFYEGNQFNVKDYTAAAKSLYEVLAPKDPNADLTKIIEIYQVSQYADKISKETAENYGKYRKLIKQVEEFERSGGLRIDSTADPIVLCVYSGCSGHAVVPVSVNMDNEGNYILEVYDCNSPNSFSTLTVKKDFSGISYGRYNQASFVKYSTIREALKDADFTGESLKKSSNESNTVAIAVNRENISLKNGGGRDYSEIKGAYEQRPMSAGEEEFSGIRSFILPQDQVEYKIEEDPKAKAGDTEEDLKYYIATEDLFTEVETSDKDAELKVRSVKGTGNDSVSLTSEKSNTESEITVMDTLGIKKEISVQGSSVEVEVNNEAEMKITVSEDTAEVKVDGEKLKLDGNKANVSFFAQKGVNPMEAADMYCEFFVDKNNQLSGTAESYVTWSKETAGDVTVITKVKDEKGNLIAELKDKKTLTPGMQKVNVVFDKVKAELGGLSGEFKAVCEMTLVDADNNEIRISQPGITVKREEQQTFKPGGNRPFVPGPSVTPTPGATATPEPTQTPTPEPTQTPTKAPDNTEAPTVTLAPEETVEPTETPDMTITPPEGTEQPVVTPKPKPTKKPSVPKKSSVPKKGKVIASGSLKYIVQKSAKKNGTVAVYSAKKKDAKKVAVPKKVKLNGYSFKVTEIYQNAFAKMKKLKEVTVGSNVKKIGKNSFKDCKNLEFVIIEKNVTTIGTRAFAGCTKLNRILVKSDKIKSVGAEAFKGVTSKAIVKTSKSKWRKYCRMFMNTGKISQSALFVIEPVKLKYNGKSY